MDEKIKKVTKELADAVSDKSKETLEKAKNMTGNTKKRERKKLFVIAVILLLILGGLASTTSISNSDYAHILGMTKNEVEKKYGAPIAKPDSEHYYYSEGVTVKYNAQNKACIVTIDSGSLTNLPASEGTLMGLKLLDEIDSVEKALKRHNFDIYEESASSSFIAMRQYKNSKYQLNIIYNNYSNKIINITLYDLK